VPLHLTPAALAKAKALGVVAAALTAGGAGGMIALSQVSMDSGEPTVVINAGATSGPTAEPTESASARNEPTDAATPEATAPATPTPSAYSLPSCPPDATNHGSYVSSVAHSAPKGSGGEHGSAVSQAAHSDCGKKTHATESPKPSKPKPTRAARTASPKPSRQAKPPETHASASVPSGDAPDAKHLKDKSAPAHESNHDH
jgi:hypothetical protein